MCALRVTFIVSFFYTFKSSSFVFAPSPSIAHVQHVTYRGEVPSAHRELVQLTAATSHPTTPRPIWRRVPQSGTLDLRGRGRISVGGEPLRKKEGDRKEASSCLLAFSSTRRCSSRLVRSRAGWRPLRRSWSLVLGAALLAVGSSPATGQTRPDRTRRTGVKISPCPQLAFPSRAEGPK